MARCCSVLECHSCFWGVARWGVVKVLFGFGGGVVPTTYSAAHGGDGVKMWRWWEFGVVIGVVGFGRVGDLVLGLLLALGFWSWRA
jgi:hypothetical protein